MTLNWHDIPVTPGSLASRRLPDALKDGGFRVRPGGMAEALCAAARTLGAEGAGLPGRQQSNWARLFLSEKAYVYAEILNFDAGDETSAFDCALEEDPGHASALLHDLALRVQDWIGRVPSRKPSPFSKQIEQLDARAGLRDRIAALTGARAQDVLDVISGSPLVPDAVQAGGVLGQARAAAKAARAAHALLCNAVETLKPPARTAFDQRLRSREIDPAIGLLIAELKAAEHVDTAINAFTARHVRFYYDDIIGQKPADASPERALLRLGPAAKPLFLPEGATLEARQGDAVLQRFATDAPVHVSPARVSAIASLGYQTDGQISFKAALDGITGVRAGMIPAGQPIEERDRVFSSGVRQPLNMGLDIASHMFALSEGERMLEVSLHMRRRANLPAGSLKVGTPEAAHLASDIAETEVILALQSDPELLRTFANDRLETEIARNAKAIVALAETRGVTPSMALIYEYLTDKVDTVRELRVLLGRIVTLSLVEGHPFPADDYWNKLFALIDAHRGALTGQTESELKARQDGLDAHGTIVFEAFSARPDGTIDYSPEDVFQQLLGDAFTVTLGSADGPVEATVTQVLSFQGSGDGGLTLRLRLDARMPAITGARPGDAPVLSLRMAESARICPVSFFERYALENVQIAVRVEGLQKVQAFSDDSPLALDQTFVPFGPAPDDGDSFFVASDELARKPVTDIGVDLIWADLPEGLAGFESHYADYPGNARSPDPKIKVEYLAGDGWKPVTDAPVPMFLEEPISGGLARTWHFHGSVPGHPVRAGGRVKPEEFSARQTVRAGAVRMTLSGTAGGFHADQYPMALVQAMRPRLWPFGTRRVPPAPFVPRVASLSLSYVARSTIEVHAPDAANPGERITQTGPFGEVELFPSRMLRDIHLFPPRLGYGHLFIQLTGPGITGPLCLLFDMAESGHLRVVPKANPIRWFYLGPTGWTPLPDTAISSDTTAGLLRSGLAMIDLPEEARSPSPEMPSGGAWIAAVATEPRLGDFPKLALLETNGVWAIRQNPLPHDKEAPRVWTFAPAVAGLGTTTEVPVKVEVRPPEAPDHFTARVGERLRHRRRAITPWDMERLVLEEFPEVWMAKCLPNLDRRQVAPCPGRATLVCVRRQPQTLTPQMLDVSTLQRIHDFVAGIAPQLAAIDVVNPAYDLLHVRGKLTFDAFRDDGAMARRLSRDLDTFLSVWTAPDTLARFGWTLNLRMLSAHIRDLDYVRGLTDFSVLHLARDDAGSHVLLDSAQDDWRGGHLHSLRAARPWSLPISAGNHALTVVGKDLEEDPIQSGIGRLPVGGMLIVGQGTTP